jgi:hypothetical protein
MTFTTPKIEINDTRPLKDEKHHPVGFSYSEGRMLIAYLKGEPSDFAVYRLNDDNITFKLLRVSGQNVPTGNVTYADIPDEDGWLYFQPTETGRGPRACVFNNTHEMQVGAPKGKPNWSDHPDINPKWVDGLIYRYRPRATPKAVFDFLETLGTDSMGSATIDGYTVRFAGFTSQCWSSLHQDKDVEAPILSEWQAADPLVNCIASGWTRGDTPFTDTIFYGVFK